MRIRIDLRKGDVGGRPDGIQDDQEALYDTVSLLRHDRLLGAHGGLYDRPELGLDLDVDPEERALGLVAEQRHQQLKVLQSDRVRCVGVE